MSHRVTEWRWPINAADYDRRPAPTRRDVASLERPARLPQRFGPGLPVVNEALGRLIPTKVAPPYSDAATVQRYLRTIDVVIDQHAVRVGAAPGHAWRFSDLGHGYCTYDRFDQCPHRMACPKCSWYRPKERPATRGLDGTAGLLRLKQEIRLTDAEAAAVEDGETAFDALLAQLSDVPTPAGPTPRELEHDPVSTLTAGRKA
jgi:hypothetical protein